MTEYQVGDIVRITKEYRIKQIQYTFGDPLPLVGIDMYGDRIGLEPEDIELVRPAWATEIPQEHWNELV